MNNRTLPALFLAVAVFSCGCSFELSGKHDQDIKRMEVEIETLQKHKAQLACLEEDIADLNRNLEKKREELKIFKSEYPDVVKSLNLTEQ